MDSNKEKLRIFMRRKGQYVAGGLLAAAFIGLMILGMNKSVNIGSDYINTEKVQKQIEEKAESLAIDAADIWDKYYRLDDLGLRYDAHIEDLDGEMFIYSVDFDRAVDDNTVKELDEQIIKKCGKPSDDNYYGEYTIEKSGDKSLKVILDLGSAYDGKAITGIFKALNDIEGVTKTVVNSSEVYSTEYSKKIKAPDANATTEEESNRAWAEYAAKLKQHFDSLGLYFPVECEALGTAFTIRIVFEKKPDTSVEDEIDKKLGKLAEESKTAWSVLSTDAVKANSITIIVTADTYEYVQPEEAALCDSMLKLLDSDFKGITKVSIV